MIRTRAARTIAFAAGLACVAPAAAHDFYLIPDRSAPDPGGTVRIGLHVSDVFPGAPTDWRADRTREFFLVDAAGRLDLKDRAPDGKPLMPSITLRSAGTTVVALVSEPAYIELKPREFRSYVKAEGHDDILEMREKMGQGNAPGRERYRRYVKTIVNAGGRASDAALAVLNLTIEIVPEAQPAEVRPGGTLPVRVLFEGTPYAGGYLCATHEGYSSKPEAYAWCGRLDDAGRAAVPIRGPGWQLLRITRMRALAGDDRADWASYWAALTFEAPKGNRP